MELPSRLRQLRLERGMSQGELGRMLGLAKQTISSYETGGSNPDPATLSKLADYFGVSVDYLLGRTSVSAPVETTATHRTDGYDRDLPEEAKRSIEDFKEYIRKKYAGDKDKDHEG